MDSVLENKDRRLTQELIMMMGIQGSGKSFWAKEFVKKNPYSVRLNNDEFRLTFFNRAWDEKDTKLVDAAREKLIVEFLESGATVIVDNMNLSPKYETRYRQLAEKYKIAFKIQDFTGVPLQICIDRDKLRERPVGEKVIRKTHKQFIAKEPPKIVLDPKLPDAIICDLDGTLALMCDRSPYDEAKSDCDFVNDYVYWAISNMVAHDGRDVILMSGRDEGRGREATERWLEKNNVPYDYLYMRKAGDVRADDIIKEELYNEHVKGKFNISAVFDDRLRVCRLWYRLGLPLFRVGDPDSDF